MKRKVELTSSWLIGRPADHRHQMEPPVLQRPAHDRMLSSSSLGSGPWSVFCGHPFILVTPRSVHHFFLASSQFCDSCPGRFSASSVCNQFPGVQLWCSANLFRAEFENSKLRIEGRMRIRNCSSMQHGACSHSLCQALWIYKIVKILNSNKICRAIYIEYIDFSVLLFSNLA